MVKDTRVSYKENVIVIYFALDNFDNFVVLFIILTHFTPAI